MQTERAPAPHPIPGELVIIGSRDSGIEKFVALLRDRGLEVTMVYDAADIERNVPRTFHVCNVGEFVPASGAQL